MALIASLLTLPTTWALNFHEMTIISMFGFVCSVVTAVCVTAVWAVEQEGDAAVQRPVRYSRFSLFVLFVGCLVGSLACMACRIAHLFAGRLRDGSIMIACVLHHDYTSYCKHRIHTGCGYNSYKGEPVVRTWRGRANSTQLR